MTSARRFASVSLRRHSPSRSARNARPLPAFADAPLSGAITSATGERHGRRDRVGEGRRLHHHHQRLHRRRRATTTSRRCRKETTGSGRRRCNSNARSATSRSASRGSRISCCKPITDREAWIRQLPGDEFLAALPGDTPEDFRMKTQVRKNCTGCHSASYVLQHRFDEEGWYKIMDLMKQVNVNGTYPRPDKRMTPNIDFHQQELAALSGAGARTGRELDAVQSAAAPVRRSGAHRGQGIRLPDRGQSRPDQ